MPKKRRVRGTHAANFARVKFTVAAKVGHGEDLYVVGSPEGLGGWEPAKSVRLYTKPERYPHWYTLDAVSLPRNKPVEYKYIVVSGGDFSNPRWEKFAAAGNRRFVPRRTDVLVSDQFGSLEPPLRMSHAEAGSVGSAGSVTGHSAVVSGTGSITDGGSVSGGEGAASGAGAGAGAGSTTHASSVAFSAEGPPEAMRLLGGKPGLPGAGSVGTAPEGVVAASGEEGEEEDDEEEEVHLKNGVIIVAYYLPVRLGKNSEGAWVASWDDEALLSRKHGSAHLAPRVTWVGCPPIHVPRSEQSAVRRVLHEMSCAPVFLEPTMAKQCLSGFCKNTLWGILHNIVGVYGATPTRWVNPARQEARWQAYMAVNRIFAKKIPEVYNDGDLVWVHDYHLLLCPEYISRRLHHATVGLFVHSPFPSSEVFRTLSCRGEILNGMLAASHIGFHLFEYARHFIMACRRINQLSVTETPGGMLVHVGGRRVSVTVSHVGIDATLHAKRLRLPLTQGVCRATREQYKDKVVLAGIDSIHSLQGLPLKLAALEDFLDSYPAYRDRIVLVQYGYGGSAGAEKGDDDTLSEIRRRVESINKRYGPVVQFEHKHEVSLNLRLGLWQAADILLNTTIRDALNLYPLEFVFAQRSKPVPGVTILSEFLGASRVLIGAIHINPWRVHKVASVIRQAVEMSDKEKVARQASNMLWVNNNTISKWAQRMLEDLQRSGETEPESAQVFQEKKTSVGSRFRTVRQQIGIHKLTDDRESSMIDHYRHARKRVILLDYGGTLAVGEGSESLHPGLSMFKRKEKESLSPAMLTILQRLSRDPKNIVFIISGQRRSVLQNSFRDLPQVGVAAENGFYYRWGALAGKGDGTPLPDAGSATTTPTVGTVAGSGSRAGAGASTASTSGGGGGGESMDTTTEHESDTDVGGSSGAGTKWHIIAEHLDMSWMEIAEHVMNVYTMATNGSFVLRKASSVVWYYGGAEPEFGRMQAQELQEHLTSVLGHCKVSVLMNHDNVEVRLRGVNKGFMVSKVMERLGAGVDFVLCVGDDQADESMFIEVHRRAGLTDSGEPRSSRSAQAMTKRRQGGGGGGGGGAAGSGAGAGAGAGGASASAGGPTAGGGGVWYLPPSAIGELATAESGDSGAEPRATSGTDEDTGPTSGMVTPVPETPTAASAGATVVATAPSQGATTPPTPTMVATGSTSPSMTALKLRSPPGSPKMVPLSARARRATIASGLMNRTRARVTFLGDAVGDARPAGAAGAGHAGTGAGNNNEAVSAGGSSSISGSGAAAGANRMLQLPVAWTCTVGMKRSNARYYADDRDHVQGILKALSRASTRRRSAWQHRVRSMNDLTTMRQLQQTATMSLSFGRGIGFKTQLDRSRPAAAWDSSPTPVRSIGGVPARPGLRQSTSDGSGSSASSVGVSSGGGGGGAGGGVGSGASAGIASTGSAGRTRGRWGPSAASAGAQQDGPNTAFGFLNASVGSEPDRNQGRAASSWEGATAANSNGGGGSIGVNATSAAPASGTSAALEAAASASMAAAAAAATATATGAGGVATPSTAASTSLTATASNSSATPGASGSDTDATGSPARRRPFPLMRSTSSNKLRQEAVRAASQDFDLTTFLRHAADDNDEDEDEGFFM